MGELIDTHLLSIVTFFPLVTGLALLALSGIAALAGRSGLPDALWKALGFASTVVTLLLSLRLFAVFDPGQTAFQFIEHVPWIPEYGVNYFVGIDGISLMMVVLTTFLMPIVLAASWNDIARSVKTYVFFMLFLETGMLGAFVSLNVFQFYVF